MTQNRHAPRCTKASGNSFANVVAGWTVENGLIETNQSPLGNLKKSDLQIAAVIATGSATKAFSMAHQMGLLKGIIPAAAIADNVIVYDGNTYNGSATGEKWTRVTAECTSATWNASTTFTSSTNKPYHDTTNKILYYVAKAEDATISISATAGTQLYAWSVSGDNTTVSTKNVCKSFTIATPDYSNAFNQKIWKFSYSGEGKQWVAPHTGTYTMECWGAKGGDCVAQNKYKAANDLGGGVGGIGGYTKGTITIDKDKSLYMFVGGGVNYDTTTGGWNGGGNGSTTGNQYGYGGGGATDIRVYVNASKSWNNEESIKSRIMVAGGGGGSGSYQEWPSTGGAGGGLVGQGGYQRNGYNYPGTSYSGTAGTQTSGGTIGDGDGTQASLGSRNAGGFGYGGYNNATSFRSPGGGSGYWGGAAAIRGHGGGGGGSSFISGMTGCVALSGYRGDNNTILKYNNVQYIFFNASTIAGNESGIPSNPGYVNTNITNGYARVTYIP